MKTINDYAELVKEEHALNKTLAPVEDDLTGASQPYAKGAKFIYNGIMYQAKIDIAQGAALVLNTNYEAADDVETQIANEAAARSQMGAKNLLPFDLATIKANNTTGTWNNNVYTLNGVDFTFNADGSVLVDGTASANAELDYLLNLSISGDFILSDAVAGVASNYWAFAKVDGDSANLLILTSDEMPASISSTMDYFRIKVFSGKTASNVLFKPMLRLATDADPTYQPYAKTNKELTDDVSSLNSAITNEVETRAKLGAHNLIPNNAVSTTNNDVTYTVNADGSVTANGTASGNSVFQFLASDEFFENNFVDGEKYILSGCPSGGGDSTYCIQTFRTPTAFDYGDGVEFTYHSAGTGKLVQIVVFDGVTVSNLTFYPMIRLATDANADYQPYAMTNQQMTPYVQAISNPNLFDNPWFTVNQRGESSYLGTSAAYTVDRWKKDGGLRVGIESDGALKLYRDSNGENAFVQYLEDKLYSSLVGKKVTLSILAKKAGNPEIQLLYNNGTTTIRSEYISITSEYELYTFTFVIDSASANFRVGLSINVADYENDFVYVKAMKLEIGTVSTLKMDTTPNYATELLKCQRYFVRYKSTGTGNNLSIGYQHSTDQILVVQTLPTNMRALPTSITISGTLRCAVNDATSAITITSITAAAIMNNILKITIVATGLQAAAGSIYWCYLSNGNYMDISADL